MSALSFGILEDLPSLQRALELEGFFPSTEVTSISKGSGLVKRDSSKSTTISLQKFLL